MTQPRTPLASLDPNSIRRKELSSIQRAQICTAHLFGHKPSEIATVLNHPVPPVKTTLSRASSRPNYASKPRSGRPKVYDDRAIRTILRFARRNPKITYSQLKRETGLEISRSTLYRILKDNGIKNWIAQKRPKLTEEHTKLRLAFVERYKDLTPQY